MEGGTPGRNSTPAYLLSPADCQRKAKYYLSCSCGLSSLAADKTFEWGEKGNHVWSTEEPTLYIINPLYEYSAEVGGPVEVDYLHVTTVGTLRDMVWDMGYHDQLLDLKSDTPISPCPTCGKTNVKSAKIYEVNQTRCIVAGCTARNSNYVLSWECYDCSRTNSQDIPVIHITHTYGPWNVITPATCTTAGTEKRVCTFGGCDVFETRTISALGHNLEFVRIITESTSSSVAGTKLYRCSRCGHEEERTYYASEGGGSDHNCVDFTWVPTGEWEAATSHGNTGHYPVKRCSKCGYTRPGLVGADGIADFVVHDIDSIEWEMHDGTAGLAVPGASIEHYYWKHCPVCRLIIDTKDHERHNEDDVRESHTPANNPDKGCGYCGLPLTIYDYHCDKCGLKIRTERKCNSILCEIRGQLQ